MKMNHELADIKRRLAAVERRLDALEQQDGQALYDEALMVREAAKGNWGPLKEWNRRQRDAEKRREARFAPGPDDHSKGVSKRPR